VDTTRVLNEEKLKKKAIGYQSRKVVNKTAIIIIIINIIIIFVPVVITLTKL